MFAQVRLLFYVRQEIMMRGIRLAFILLGVVIISWNLSAYRANVKNSEKIDSEFERFVKLAQQQEDSMTHDLWGELHRTRVMASQADGLYDGWNHRIPQAGVGGILLVAGLLMFRLTPSHKRVEQDGESDS